MDDTPFSDEPADLERPWTPARVAPVSGQIVSQIRRALFKGDLSPGQFLGSENQLAQRFGASRGTIRTALRTLEALGVIDIKAGAGGGIRVADGNPDRFAEALAVQFKLVGVSRTEHLEAQIAIESATAKLAARNATETDLANLRYLVAQARSIENDAPRFSQLGLAFHLAVADAAHNRALAIQLRALRHQMWPENDQRPTGKTAQRLVAVHSEIYERILARDEAGAERAMREHLDHVRTVSAQEGSAKDAKNKDQCC
jgi:GntR family transcriptional repressor for pyruvate dehydrogenase complex